MYENKLKLNIESGKEYNSDLNLKIIPKELEGDYNLEQTVIRIDKCDGLVEGRTCKIISIFQDIYPNANLVLDIEQMKNIIA